MNKISWLFLIALTTVMVGCGGSGGKGQDTVKPDPIPPTDNEPPVITLPLERTVNAEQVVTLTAKATDNVKISTVRWEVITPQALVIENADSATLTFTALQHTQDQRYSFSFTATDSSGLQTSGRSYVTVNQYNADAITATVQIDSAVKERSESLSNNYQLVVGDSAISIDLKAVESITLPANDSKQAALAVNGEAILLNLSPENTDEIELSINTSADSFILRHRLLLGKNIADYGALQTQIRQHEQYSALVSIVKDYISFSRCPLDLSCNPSAVRVANIIAQDLDLTSITQEREQ